MGIRQRAYSEDSDGIWGCGGDDRMRWLRPLVLVWQRSAILCTEWGDYRICLDNCIRPFSGWDRQQSSWVTYVISRPAGVPLVILKGNGSIPGL